MGERKIANLLASLPRRRFIGPPTMKDSSPSNDPDCNFSLSLGPGGLDIYMKCRVYGSTEDAIMGGDAEIAVIIQTENSCPSLQ